MKTSKVLERYKKNLKNILISVDSYFALKNILDTEQRYQHQIMLYFQIGYLLASNCLYFVEDSIPFTRYLYTTVSVPIRLVLLKKNMQKTLLLLTMIDWLVLPFLLLQIDEVYKIRTVGYFLVIPYIVNLFFLPKACSAFIGFENVVIASVFNSQIRQLMAEKGKEWVIATVDVYTSGMLGYTLAVWILSLVQHNKCERLVDARERAIASLQKANEQLSKTVEELNQAKHQLQLALKSKDYLLAGVSHELRNPLNSLLGSIDLLSLEVTDAKHQEMLNIAKVCGEQLITMINNLVDAGKMMSHIEISPMCTDIYDVLDKVWKVQVLKFKEKKLRGELIVSKKLPNHIFLDSQRIKQILINLLMNSIKFTATGTVQFYVDWYTNDDVDISSITKPQARFKERVERKAVCDNKQQLKRFNSMPAQNVDEEEELVKNRIDLEYKYSKVKYASKLPSTDHYIFTAEDVDILEKLTRYQKKFDKTTETKKGVVKFEVVDTGCGINEDAQEKLFQPFAQEDSTVTRKYGGAGLGLFIIKSVLTKMNGKITLYSTKNVGTDIIVTVPSEEIVMNANFNTSISTEKISPYAKNPSERKRDEKVLIVDDTPYNLMILSQYMTKLGMKVTQCDNGKEALTIYTSVSPNHFSFLSLDIQMPEIDGITLAKAIRQFEKSHKRSPVPIVFVSGNCVEEEQQACIDPQGEIRAAYFFRKPLAFQDCQKFTEALRQDPKTVLIVDDDTYSIRLLSSLLLKRNINSIIAHNSTEALELLKNKTYNFNAIVMDCEIFMRNEIMTFVNMKKWLKDLKGPDLPVIGITDHSNSSFTQKCIESGMAHVLDKPVNYLSFAEYLNNLICNN
jgi:signal transduction histidine kinase/response regulator RpfG family c-di-GMP phosphodiesterase